MPQCNLVFRFRRFTFAACIILGQLTASVVVDHFGWVGFPQHSVSLQRLAGLGLLAIGLVLIHRS